MLKRESHYEYKARKDFRKSSMQEQRIARENLFDRVDN